MFHSEKEMQDWLSKVLQDVEGLSNLILPHSFPKKLSYANEKVRESYEYCLRALNMTEVVCEDKDISQFPDEVLRPDFLLYSIETESWVIVELKNIKGPTRQAATELSAYANAIKSYFPGISDGDVINVIVSNEWPTLLKNYVFNEIYWLNRRIVCFKPVSSGLETKLECIDPNEFTRNYSHRRLTPDSFSGYQLCLYGKEVNTGGDISDLENHLEQIRSSLYRIVSRSSSLHSHGFAFLWRDFRQHSSAAYSITIVDINPYKNDLYESCQSKGIAHDLQKILNEYEAAGNTFSLSEIMEDGDYYLRSICRSWPEAPSSWENLKQYMLQDSDLVEFRCWGVVAEIYESELSVEYEKGNITTKYECPDFGLEFVENRLFNR